ncbi:hypothetical protein BGX31_002927, partial [Mortierella sp. GBA43]
VTIPTRYDSKSSQRIVRWKDIQQYFENAKGILNGKHSVLFLTDDDLEDLVPLRIAHHPGVVLEVLVTDNTRGYPSPTDNLGFTSSGLDSHIQPLEHLISLRASNSLRDSYTRQSVATLPQYTPASRTDQHNHDDPPRLLCGVEGSMDQGEQLGQLRQQTQQMQGQIDEILRLFETQTASIQQLVEEIAQKTEKSEHQTQQELQQLQEWVKQADRGNPFTLDQIRGEFSKRQLEILNRHIVMHDRIQALLRDSTKESSVPRLFFILPKDINQGHGNDDPSSREFRLHFLCNFGSHTTSKDSKKEPYEVHMTNHPGYDLKRPKEFFDEYGSYVLTMMYMIKYGAMAAGTVVHPLLQSRHTGMIEQSQGHHRLSKENFNRLVDDTITHLECMALPIDHGMNMEGSRGSSDVKSYLEVNGDGKIPGDMHQLTRPEQHCSWVCREHKYEWTLQQLKDVVNTIGGTHIESPGNIDIKVDPSNVTKQLYDVVTEIMIQCTKDRPLLNMDCGRLSLKTGDSRYVQDVVMTIKRLSDLTTDDIDFIQQCNIIKLSIEYTPMKTDEDRLIKVLQQSHTLNELCIGCLGERSLDIINLVVSTRETALQDGRPTALHTFKLMEEELKPFILDRTWDEHVYISVTLTFSAASTKFDADTHLLLQKSKEVAEGDWIYKFFRQYGWSISHLNTASRFNDSLATLLDDSTQIHGSKLVHLILSQYTLSDAGMDSVDRLIKRSRGLTFFEEWFHISDKVAPSLERHGTRLNTIMLSANSKDWLPAVLKKFPPRSSLPMLDYLGVLYDKQQNFPHECTPWLFSMVSDPCQLSDPSMVGHSWTGTPQHTEKPYMAPTRLKRLRLSNIILIPEVWEALINAIGSSVMLELRFNGTNFSQEQLDLLLD